MIMAVLPLYISKQNFRPYLLSIGSDTVGKILSVHNPTSIVSIPVKYQPIMETDFQKFVADLLSNQAAA
jgi:hypothetical protein